MTQTRELQPKYISLSKSLGIDFFEALFSLSFSFFFPPSPIYSLFFSGFFHSPSPTPHWHSFLWSLFDWIPTSRELYNMARIDVKPKSHTIIILLLYFIYKRRRFEKNTNEIIFARFQQKLYFNIHQMVFVLQDLFEKKQKISNWLLYSQALTGTSVGNNGCPNECLNWLESESDCTYSKIDVVYIHLVLIIFFYIGIQWHFCRWKT